MSDIKALMKRRNVSQTLLKEKKEAKSDPMKTVGIFSFKGGLPYRKPMA